MKSVRDLPTRQVVRAARALSVAALVLVVPPTVWIGFNCGGSRFALGSALFSADALHGPLTLLAVTTVLSVVAILVAATVARGPRWPPWRIAIVVSIAGALAALGAAMAPLVLKSSDSIGAVPDLIDSQSGPRADTLVVDGERINVYEVVLRHPTVHRHGWAPRRTIVGTRDCGWVRNAYGLPLRCIDGGPESWGSRQEYLGEVLPRLLREGHVRPLQFAVNTTITVVALLVAIVGPRWIRWRHRVQRSECVECGYALVGRVLCCPECGTANRSATTAVVASMQRGRTSGRVAWILTVVALIVLPLAWLLHNHFGGHAEWALPGHDPWHGPVATIIASAVIAALLLAAAFVDRPLDRRRVGRLLRLAAGSVMIALAIAVLTPAIVPPSPRSVEAPVLVARRTQFARTLAATHNAWVPGEFIVVQRRFSDLYGVDCSQTPGSVVAHVWLWEEFGVPLRCLSYCLPPSELWPGRRAFLVDWAPRVLVVARVDALRLAINSIIVVLCILVLGKVLDRVGRRWRHAIRPARDGSGRVR